MGCGCGGKASSRNIIKTNGGCGAGGACGSNVKSNITSGGSTHTYTIPSYSTTITDAQPSEWGPLFWSALHTIANKLGKSGNRELDIKQGYLIRTILVQLPSILPCQQCANHAKEYMKQYRIPELDTYRGADLNKACQSYLLKFHNTVRTRLGQNIIIPTFIDCDTFYKTQNMTPEKISSMNAYGLYGVNQQWINIDVWKTFMSNMDELRILSL